MEPFEGWVKDCWFGSLIGYGWVRNPKKFVYNTVYNKTSSGGMVVVFVVVVVLMLSRNPRRILNPERVSIQLKHLKFHLYFVADHDNK